MFRHPGLLWLFLIYIPLIAWYLLKHRDASPSMGISSTSAFAKMPRSWKAWLMHALFILQLGAIGCIIVALARPQTHDAMNKSRIEGTDIVLALDISGSMSAKDLLPNRFLAAKDVAEKFISARENDNIGLVVFSGESLSLMPLTNDRGALVNTLRRVELGDLHDGTAIGDGLASAINRISSGTAKSKSIILLTDGTNNSGDVPPETAAEIARGKGIRVYTIGVGTDGAMQITDPYGFSTTTIETKIDEQSLTSIAKATGGKYFRATDRRMLQNVFDEIDRLEKTVLDVDRYTRTDEAFMPWMLAALLCVVVQLTLRYTVLRRIP